MSGAGEGCLCVTGLAALEDGGWLGELLSPLSSWSVWNSEVLVPGVLNGPRTSEACSELMSGMRRVLFGVGASQHKDWASPFRR